MKERGLYWNESRRLRVLPSGQKPVLLSKGGQSWQQTRRAWFSRPSATPCACSPAGHSPGCRVSNSGLLPPPSGLQGCPLYPYPATPPPRPTSPLLSPLTDCSRESA